MTKVKIGIAITLIASVAALGYLYRAELQRGARQAAVIVQQRAELTDKQHRIEDLARQRDAAEAVAAREKERAVEIRDQSRGLRDDIQRLERENEAVRGYLDTRMPADLYSILREDADGDSD